MTQIILKHYVKNLLPVICLLILAACNTSDDELPTRIPDTPVPFTHTPDATLPPTWTKPPTFTMTPSITITPSVTLTHTPTLSAIQQTEMFLYSILTSTAIIGTQQAETATAFAIPTATPGLFQAQHHVEQTWRDVSLSFSLERMGEISGLPRVVVTQEGALLTYTWENQALTVRHDAINGELVVTSVRYLVDNAPMRPAEGILIQIRDNLLGSIIAPGEYHLLAVEYQENLVILHLRLP